MQRFKKRLRLLTEKHGGTIAHGHDDSLIVSFKTGTAYFSTVSYDSLHCDATVGDTSFPIRAPKSFCFDITFRLASAHLSDTLKNYQPGQLLKLADYIREEHGGLIIQQFKQRLASDPSITNAEFGGHRILAAYYHGVIILYDYLCMDATNVLEL